jgi:transcriptional regulator with XRE-family HTH domain
MTGKQIKDVRLKFDFSVKELSEFLGVEISTVYRWQASGSKQLKVDGLQRLLLDCMHETAQTNVKKIVTAFRKKGAVAGLHKLLGFAYKN